MTRRFEYGAPRSQMIGFIHMFGDRQDVVEGDPMHLISRAELFDLVWSHPRTTLAARFEVSDVAIAKKCRSTNIPMPPPGYWARVASGAKKARPVLPLRIPGERDIVMFGESRYESPGETVDGELKPPAFAEEVDLLVDAAIKRLGRVRAQRDLTDPHSGLGRLLRKEEQRRQKFAEAKWDFYAPKYDDPVSQRKLRLYSALFRAFSTIGTKGSVGEMEEWKQGIGTTYWLAGSLDFDGARVQLLFLPTQVTGKGADLKLLVGGDSEAKAHSVWADEPQLPLEKRLDDIARDILVCAELRMRSHAQQRYEWRLEERARRAREEEERRRAEEARHVAQMERELKLRREAVHAAAARWRQSLEIRSLVAALADAHPELTQDARFTAWCEFALDEANRVDPVRGGLADLLGITSSSSASVPN